MPAKVLICKDCGEDFDFTEEEQRRFSRNGWGNPVRCVPCQQIKLQDHEASR